MKISGFPNNDPINIGDENKKKNPIEPTGDSKLNIFFKSIKEGDVDGLLNSLLPYLKEEFPEIAGTIDDSYLDDDDFLEDDLSEDDYRDVSEETIKKQIDFLLNLLEDKEVNRPVNDLEKIGSKIVKKIEDIDYYNIALDFSKLENINRLLKEKYILKIKSEKSNIEIDELKYIGREKYYVLYQAKCKDSIFYIALIKNEENKIEIFVPSIYNTAKIIKTEEKDKIIILPNDASLKDNQILDFVKAGLTLELAGIQENIIITPNQFGKLENTSVYDYQRDLSLIRIGNIISNESEKSLCIKKDAEYEGTRFPFYIKLPEAITNVISFEEISENLKKCELDLTKTKLFDVSDLKFKKVNGVDAFYIEL